MNWIDGVILIVERTSTSDQFKLDRCKLYAFILSKSGVEQKVRFDYK